MADVIMRDAMTKWRVERFCSEVASGALSRREGERKELSVVETGHQRPPSLRVWCSS